jgi:hypothetical protein
MIGGNMPETQDAEAIKAKMDEAAKAAEKELKKLDKEAVKVVATWMKTHFTAAGYKRLSRLLVNSVKE